ncbi:TetR/AcrR family transcriptional regulator [Lysobacter sp. A6]|uniref:TetR/AcrR family transcriptional regulator n=1 Tax=Noviluteimonas lactosilytica TaxID=2888523 RepID=A0ABS8JES2_9GAMM|nr:TetR/AcrR family transcriptional regulator [Lysobacter lactosilyticus]MCC8362010.1 TetR/AcrR family transcriptional regulator [Lysobacter lactosilyticus]
MPDGRPNQRQRTRKDLLAAAAKLMQQGRTPTLDEVAEAAMVSRATAYRYFPGVEALLAEASVDVEVPEADAILKGANADPVARLERIDDALSSVIGTNEHALRTMLVHSLQRQAAGDESVPKRQNRRTPLIEAALEPARAEFKPADYKLLAKSLALVIGTEAMLVFKDVLRVDDAEARKVKRFMIRALVQAARK